jgi:hypothetical protein
VSAEWSTPEGPPWVMRCTLDDDGLVLLSFSADTLGVERYAPQPGCARCGESADEHPVSMIGDNGLGTCGEWVAP